MNPSTHFTFLRLSREGKPNHTLNLWEEWPQARFDPEGLCRMTGHPEIEATSRHCMESVLPTGPTEDGGILANGECQLSISGNQHTLRRPASIDSARQLDAF
jgi:hypothetical protein